MRVQVQKVKKRLVGLMQKESLRSFQCTLQYKVVLVLELIEGNHRQIHQTQQKNSNHQSKKETEGI